MTHDILNTKENAATLIACLETFGIDTLAQSRQLLIDIRDAMREHKCDPDRPDYDPKFSKLVADTEYELKTDTLKRSKAVFMLKRFYNVAV